MRNRSKPSLQLSLLSYAIAAAAAGVAPGAYAVDLCAGNAAVTISTNATGDTCTLDTAAAALTITATGSIDSQISVNITDAVVSNAGTIDTSVTTSSWTSVYGIEAGALGTGASISNSGTITVSATSTSSSASANGIRFGALTGGASVTNSGTVTAAAEAEQWAGAYAVGNWNGGTFDDGHISNDATGVITATSTGGGDYWYASAYGIFNSATLTNDSSISNAGTITATTTAEGDQDASAWGIYTSTVTDSSISNSGTLTTSATSGTTGTAWAGAWGVDAGDLNGTATVSNSGTVSATAAGVTNATAWGIETGALYGTASVVNSGGISATTTVSSGDGYAYGIETGSLNDTATVSNTATGTIAATVTADTWASAYGISVGNQSATASVSNAGTITASATSVNSSASAWGIHTDSLNGAITNSGSVTVTVAVDEISHWAGAYGLGTWGWGALDGEAITNDATGTITASASGYYGSAYGIIAWAPATNGAAIDNQGSITATATGEGGNYASAWGIYTYALTDSSISNSGIISATATNNGSDWAGAWGIYQSSGLNGSSSVSNSGTITATATSTASSASAHGIEIGTLYDTSSLTNSGSITATASALSGYGYAYGIYTSSLNDTATVSNTATGTIAANITADTWASAYGITTAGGGLNDTSSISNAGTITATATSVNSSAWAWGIDTGPLHSGSVTNSGSITATASGTSAGQWAGAQGIGNWNWASMDGVTITNTADGTITASASGDSGEAYGILASGYPSNGSSIVNAGTITATTTGGDGSSASAYGIYTSTMYDSSISNSGTVTASATGGDAWAGAWGIIAGDLNGDSSISNSATGTINATIDTGSYGSAYGIEVNNLFDTATISNAGTITVSGTAATWLSVYGIDADGVHNSAAITNSGSITVTATSLSSSASAYGIHAGNMTGGSLSNSGDIVVSATAATPGEWVGVYSVGSWNWTTMNGFTLENAAGGTITGTATADNASAYGLYAWSDVTNGSSISNAGAIDLTVNAGTVWGGAYGMYIGNVDGTSSVTNSGTITATTTVTDSATGSAYGIYVNSLASGGTLTNSGTITVAGSEGVDLVGIAVGGGAGDVINAATGSIGGGVRLNGTVSLQNDGNVTLAVGMDSNVGGDYTQGATGQLTTVVKDSSTYGQITVAGTADLSANGKLVVELDPTLVLTTGTVLNDVVTAGTLTAPASYDIVDSSQFWNFANVGDATTIDLAATQVDAAIVLAGSGAAFTDSQLDLVNAIVGGGYGPTYSALTGALNTASTPAAAAAIVQQLNPALTGSAGRAALSASSGIGALIDARQAETGAASGDAAGSNGVWLKTFLGKAEQDAVGGVNGFDADTTGFVLGLDGDVSDSWRVGVAVASASTDADDINSALEIDTLQFSVYGNYAVSDSTSLDVDVNHAVNGVDSTRRVVFAGSTAVASYDGSQFVLGAGLTHRAKVGGNVTLLPGVALRYRQVHLDGYTETGAGAYDLTVQSRTDSALLWQARLGAEVGLGGVGTLLANVGAGYDTLDAASATATLSGTGPTFISQGAKPESTVLNAGLGYRYVTAKGFEINALYELEDRDTFNAETASLKFRMPF